MFGLCADVRVESLGVRAARRNPACLLASLSDTMDRLSSDEMLGVFACLRERDLASTACVSTTFRELCRETLRRRLASPRQTTRGKLIEGDTVGFAVFGGIDIADVLKWLESERSRLQWSPMNETEPAKGRLSYLLNRRDSFHTQICAMMDSVGIAIPWQDMPDIIRQLDERLRPTLRMSTVDRPSGVAQYCASHILGTCEEDVYTLGFATVELIQEPEGEWTQLMEHPYFGDAIVTVRLHGSAQQILRPQRTKAPKDWWGNRFEGITVKTAAGQASILWSRARSDTWGGACHIDVEAAPMPALAWAPLGRVVRVDLTLRYFRRERAQRGMDHVDMWGVVKLREQNRPSSHDTQRWPRSLKVRM